MMKSLFLMLILQSKKERGVPARLSWQKEKDQPYETNGRMKLTEMLEASQKRYERQADNTIKDCLYC